MFDLNEPLFTRAAVLELLPELPAGTLQNWVSRKIVTLDNQNPGRQAKRYYTGYGVIVLGFMTALIPRRVEPTHSVRMGHAVASRARELCSTDKIVVDHSGIPFIPYPATNYRDCQRHLIKNSGEKYYLDLIADRIDADNWHRTVEAPFYQVVETDFFAIDMINRILHWQFTRINSAEVDTNPAQGGQGQ